MAFSPELAASACIEKGRRLLDLAGQQLPVADVNDELCRHALVTGVTAVDSYMHWLVFRRLSDVRWHPRLPKALKKLDIPLVDIVNLAESALEGQQYGNQIRPWVQVKNAVQRKTLGMTFQSFSQVAYAFSLAGIEKPWSKISQELGEPVGEIETHLNKLVHRRNQIVHEGDIMRMSRPRDVRFNTIDVEEVISEIDWIEGLLIAMAVMVVNEA